MRKLTTKISDGFYVADHAHNTDEVTHKLGIVEELEEELQNNFSGKNEDCSFKVLFKATKYGFWSQVQKDKFIHLVPDDNHTIIYDWNGGYPILQYMVRRSDTTLALGERLISTLSQTPCRLMPTF